MFLALWKFAYRLRLNKLHDSICCDSWVQIWMASRAAQRSIKGENALGTHSLHVWPFKQAALFGCLQFRLKGYSEVQCLTNTRRVRQQPRSVWGRGSLEQAWGSPPHIRPTTQGAHCLRASTALYRPQALGDFPMAWLSILPGQWDQLLQCKNPELGTGTSIQTEQPPFPAFLLQ